MLYASQFGRATLRRILCKRIGGHPMRPLVKFPCSGFSLLIAGFVISFGLSGCGGGGGGSSNAAPAATTVISGFVSDDPIASATVTAVSTDTGVVLGTALTASDGSYALNANSNAIGAGFKLTSTGGTMLGQPFAGTLSAIYRLGSSTIQSQSNLTLITTALVEAVTTTPFTGTTLEKYQAVVADGIARGLIGADYYLVDPNGGVMAALRQQVRSLGVDATIAGLAQKFGVQPIIGGCTQTDTSCVRDVYPMSGPLNVTLQGGATISAPAGALDNCRVVASYSTAAQTLAMHLENITSPGYVTPNAVCAPTGNVTISLAAVAGQAPGFCPTLLGTSSMQHCVTIDSSISPSFAVADRGSHRSNHASHTATLPLRGEISITRNYGAVLYSSRQPSLQWTNKDAVIFVHGLEMCDGILSGSCFGGDEGTWGNLPGLVTETPSNVALNFQWRTDASFLSVANQLANAVDYAYIKTGRKVHIVAHSFGGVLARVMLQNINGLTGSSAAKVKTLTTVGTPHSGIVDNISSVTGVLPVEGVNLPRGWGSVLNDGLCGQISCYQSGLNANIASWAKDELLEVVNGQTRLPDYGYISARLKLTQNSLPPDLKILVLIGQIVANTKNGPMFSNDDGLVSYYGQRFNPQIGRNALLVNVSVGGAIVTERVLGLNPGVNALPGDLVSSAAGGMSVYSMSPPVPTPPSNLQGFVEYVAWMRGYKHTALTLTLATDASKEVSVPADCGNAAQCQHDTWVNIRQFLLDNTLTCVLPQVRQGNVCVNPPSVTTVTPATATADLPVAITVVGQNLPLTAILSMTDAVCQTPTNRLTTGFNVICTPGSTSGNKTVTIYTDTHANSGVLIDASFSINVAASNLSAVLSDDFDGTSLQSAYWTPSAGVSISGGYVSFSCSAAFISTANKVTFTGSTIIIEAGMQNGSGARQTTSFYFTDVTNSANLILGGDTNYRSIDGLIVAGSGAFSLAQSGNGISTSTYKEYRMTIAGSSVILERGDTLSNITETVTRTLPTSITGKTFFLTVGTGASPYCPSRVNWVRVKTN